MSGRLLPSPDAAERRAGSIPAGRFGHLKPEWPHYSVLKVRLKAGALTLRVFAPAASFAIQRLSLALSLDVFLNRPQTGIEVFG